MSKDLIKIINTLETISKYCNDREGCEGCKFQIKELNMVYGEMSSYCQLKELGRMLSHMPCAWDIDEIANIMDR